MELDEEALDRRSPQGAECQCAADGCGVFFSSESAFEKHWTKNGHVAPIAVGLVERASARGPVWGWPGMPAAVLAAKRATDGTDRPTGINSSPVHGEAGRSEPEPVREYSPPAGRHYTAGRGPGGGVLAMCVACGQEWERPVRAGRPAAKCEECRG